MKRFAFFSNAIPAKQLRVVKQNYFSKGIIFLLSILSHSVAFGQVDYECFDSPPEPELLTEETLCEQYGGLAPDVIINSFGHSPVLSSSLSTNVFNNQTIYIHSSMIIDNTLTFNNCTIRIAPAKRIEVISNQSPFTIGVLIIRDSKLFACDQMWKGIVNGADDSEVFGNGIVSIRDSEIEDAQYAIQPKESSITFARNTIFNRNFIGINGEFNAF